MLIDNEFINEIIEKARTSPRLRVNFNLHNSLDSSVQRMINALEPGTIMPIHRHVHTDETYIILCGQIEISIYNDDRKITNVYMLDTSIGHYGVNIPKNTWHGINVQQSGTVIFEVKEGPYTPLTPDNILN